MRRTDSALKYARLFITYSDSLKKIEDRQRIGIIEFEYRAQQEKEKNQIEKEREEVLKKRKEMILFGMIVGVFLVAMIMFLLFLLQRGKIHRMNLVESNLKLEKTYLQQDLDLKNKELTSKVMSLIEKNELLAELTKRLRCLINQTDTADPKVLQNVIHNLQHQHSEGLWEEFEVHFKGIHTDFYSRLTNEFPQLSPNEIKLCAFLKLNLSTKEISMITRKNEHSIKIARYRLRQKLGLSREENLTIFLSKY
ncbi:MAG: hypothetical protein WCL00_14585 [Bacteroidota bacterium]